MRNQRILVSWIGHTDLLAMADDLGEVGKELLAAAKISGKYGEKPGPLKTAVTREQFGEVHLLSNYPTIVHKPFARLAWRQASHSLCQSGRSNRLSEVVRGLQPGSGPGRSATTRPRGPGFVHPSQPRNAGHGRRLGSPGPAGIRPSSSRPTEGNSERRRCPLTSLRASCRT